MVLTVEQDRSKYYSDMFIALYLYVYVCGSGKGDTYMQQADPRANFSSGFLFFEKGFFFQFLWLVGVNLGFFNQP